MRNFSGLSAYLLVSLAAVCGAIAAPIPCLTTGTYQDLLNSNAGGGCTISVGAGASLIFSNFTFTPAGVGTPAASVSRLAGEHGRLFARRSNLRRLDVADDF